MSSISSLSRRLLASSLQLRSVISRHASKSSDIRADRLLDPEFNTDSGATSSKMTMISLQEDDHVYVTKYSPYGFTINNGVQLLGSNILFPNTCFNWKVSTAEDIHEGSLSLFTMIEPKPDLLLIGTGSERKELGLGQVKYLRKHGINFEVLNTQQAIATFNFQNNDQRWVMACLIPPEPSNKDIGEFTRMLINRKLDFTEIDEIDMEELESGESSVQGSLDGSTGETVSSDRIASDTLADTSSVAGSDPQRGVRSPLGSGLMLGDVLVVQEKVKKGTRAEGRQESTDNSSKRSQKTETDSDKSSDKPSDKTGKR